MKPVLHKLLKMLFEGFDDVYYDWSNYNCGMGECCDPYSIGFTLPKRHNDEHIFLLVDLDNWKPHGNYPKEMSDELPEVCYESPDVKNPDFNMIIFDVDYAEEIENFLGEKEKWRPVLLDLINEMFHCEATKLIFG